jgi:DNA-binding Xre family transcriptional regulator
MFMGRESTAFGILGQPHSVGNLNYRIRMSKKDSKQVLWENVSRLMKAHYGKENLTRLSQDAGIGPGTCTRIKEKSTSVGTDVLEAVAKALKVQPWELLMPGLGTDVKPAAEVREPSPSYTVISPAQAIAVLAESLHALDNPESREAAGLFLQKMAADPRGRWAALLVDLIEKESAHPVNITGDGLPQPKALPERLKLAENSQGGRVPSGPATTAAESPEIGDDKGNDHGERSNRPGAGSGGV